MNLIFDLIGSSILAAIIAIVIALIIVAVIVFLVIKLVRFILTKHRKPAWKVLEDSGFVYDECQDIFYSAMCSWQKKYGYCQLYDETAPMFSMIMDCEPVRFEYEGRKWLIELWKGQYGMTTGVEVGVYTTDGPDIRVRRKFNGTFYKDTRDEDRLEMSVCLYKGDRKLFERHDKHWWLTGFILGEFSEPEELTAQIKITMKSQEMARLFVEQLERLGYCEGDYWVNGCTVCIYYVTPHSPLAVTRLPVTDQVIQEKNRLLCEMYQRLTPDGSNAIEKLEILKERNPRLYRKLSTSLYGISTKKRYGGFRSIRRHI